MSSSFFFGKLDQVYNRQAGVWIEFRFSGVLRVFLANSISIIIIVEYSTTSVLEYFGDTLVNVGLPEAWIEFDSNFVARVENKYVRRDSNLIGGKQLNLIKLKPQLSLIKSGEMIQIQ